MTSILLSLAQAALVIALAPLTVGIVRTCKARFQNRRGAPVFQPYWVLFALCKKEMTITKHASWVFHAVPFVVLASAAALALFVPTLGIANGLSQSLGLSSIFLIAGILAVGSLFLVLGGMDVASAFGGMGSSREMTLAALVEPSLILSLGTLGLAARSWNLDGILAALAGQSWVAGHPFLVFTFLSLGCVILAENARYPVDNPTTHLELTMVHEAMILEYSGPYLAMLEMASAIKLTVLSVLFFNLIVPIAGASVPVAITLTVVKLAAGAILVAFLETALVKMRFYRMQEYMATAYFLGLAGFVLTLIF